MTEKVLSDNFKGFLKEFLTKFPNREGEILEKLKEKLPNLSSTEQIFEISTEQFNDFDFIEILDFDDSLDGKRIATARQFLSYSVSKQFKMEGL